MEMNAEEWEAHVAELKSRSEWHGDSQNGIEIRHNPDGSVDEVCMYIDGECVVHVEQMSTAHWWMGLYGKTHEAHVNLFPKSKRQTPITLNAEGWPAAVFTCAICGHEVISCESTIQDYKRVCKVHKV